MSEAQFQLKTAPPRVGRTVVARVRLEQRWNELCDRTAILVTAPQGFGKTTLLASWRRNWLERGAVVAWASLDAQDEHARFVDLLLFALREATGRESFSAAAFRSRLEAHRELDALTALLAEVATLATPTVIVLDDAHRMPQATLGEAMTYLLNNAPPNLQFLVGSRRPLELDLAELITGGRLGMVSVTDLRMSLAESLDLIRIRFGNRIGLDDAARLHELVEGWPLGLQLAASTLEGAPDPGAMIGQLTARRGNLQKFFFESVMSRLSAEESAFLVRISILESLHADLCEAVSGFPEAARYLEQLAETSPVVTEGEGREWLRLHALARDFLLGHFDLLPMDERRACYERAAAWYAEHGQIQEAARHALAAGNEALATDLAARCLQDIAREGHLAEANEWIERLPASAMSRDVRLQITAAWITSMGNGAAEVPRLVERITQHSQLDEHCRLETALVSAAAAIFCDKPGLVADALRDWASPPPGATVLHKVSLANCQATLAFHRGDTEQVRRCLQGSVAGATREASMRLPLGFADLLIGLTYLTDSNADKAVSVLQPRLSSAENELGRRSTVAAMLAGPLSAAYLLRADPERALATLADRLDVIERVGMPDPTMLAYRTLAFVALRRGDTARALEILAALHELGVVRDLPRVRFVSLSEQIRIHALRGHAATASEMLAQLDAMRPIFDDPAYQPFAWFVWLTRAVAAAYVHLARSELEAAELALREWIDAHPGIGPRPIALVAKALLALVAHERGRPAAGAALAEVLSLAELGGIRGFIEAAHPRIADLAGARPVAGAHVGATHAVANPNPREPAPTPVAATTGLLTPKEARLLSLLATGMANKEIARAMDIGEQTVKWHLKNVFLKLNAASRKHAVDRARLLGLLAG